MNLSQQQKAIVDKARSLKHMTYVREQCLPNVAGDCTCFVIQCYQAAGFTIKDTGRMKASGLGTGVLMDRLAQQGLSERETPRVGCLAVFTYAGTPIHLGIVTKIHTNYFEFIHLAASAGGVKEVPCTGHWLKRLYTFMEPKPWATINDTKSPIDPFQKPEAPPRKQNELESQTSKSSLGTTSTTLSKLPRLGGQKQSVTMKLPSLG